MPQQVSKNLQMFLGFLLVIGGLIALYFDIDSTISGLVILSGVGAMGVKISQNYVNRKPKP